VISYLDLTPSEREEVICQVCYALNYIHFRGHAYKYLNFNTLTILRNEEGILVKLADLPTTLHYREQLGAFSDEIEQFLPPEIIRDNDSNPTSDIYSLGVILFYLYKALPVQSCAFESILDEPQDEDVFSLVEIMTVKNASERFSTIIEFMEAFETVFSVAFKFTDKTYYEKLLFTTPLVGRDRELWKILGLIQQRTEMRSDVRHVLIQGEPGIGKTTATNIVDYRTANGPFKTRDDLLKVKGVGAKTLEKVRQLISVQ